MLHDPRYQIVGARHDGSRVVLDTGLTEERAAAVKKALVKSMAFQEVVIEPETAVRPPSSADSTLHETHDSI